MTRTLQELAREALAVQDACNLSGVAHGFSRAMADLCTLVPNTDERNTHPIAILWSSKIASLTGSESVSTFSGAYGVVVHLAAESAAVAFRGGG